jgi:hypothetical protein
MRAAVVLALGASWVGCGAVSVRVGVSAAGAECQRDFGSSTAAAKIETFLGAVAALEGAAAARELELGRACAAAAEDAGLATVVASDTAALPPTLETCGVLADWLAAERAALEGAVLASDEPACTVSMDAYAQCVSTCELRYRPREVAVACAGETDERRCTQGLSAPQAGPRCRASCETRAELESTCAEGSARLEGVEPPASERAVRLAGVWERHGPSLRLLRVRAERLAGATARLLAIAPVLPEAAATISIRAVACATAASRTASQASSRLEATLAAARRVAP